MLRASTASIATLLAPLLFWIVGSPSTSLAPAHSSEYRRQDPRIVVRIVCEEYGTPKPRESGGLTLIGHRVSYRIGDRKFETLKAFGEELKRLAEATSRADTPRPTIDIRVSEDCVYSDVSEAVDAVQAAGFEEIDFGVDVELDPGWVGNWVGRSTQKVGGETKRSFRTELRIAPIKGRDAWTWTIVYGEGEAKQVRAYELLKGEGGADHFVIDEKNGILIDTWLHPISTENQELIGRFDVMGNVIEARYTLRGNEIDMQLTTFTAEPMRESGGEGTPKVRAFRLKSVQHATLR